MAKKDTEWILRAKRQLGDLFRTTDFKIHAKELKDNFSTAEFDSFCDKHRVPYRYRAFLNIYIQEGKKYWEMIEPPAEYVDELFEIRVPSIIPAVQYYSLKKEISEDTYYLALKPDITQRELIDFIKINWNKFIKQGVGYHAKSIPSKKIIRNRPSLSRHEEVYSLHIKGYKNKKISDLTGVDQDSIKKIIKRSMT